MQNSITEWVVANLEESAIAEVTRHGCEGGAASALIYYTDTCAFYEQHEDEIWDRLYQMASDMGEASILHLISSFNGAKGALTATGFKNLLAWWACEEVCREIIEEKEGENDDRKTTD